MVLLFYFGNNWVQKERSYDHKPDPYPWKRRAELDRHNALLISPQLSVTYSRKTLFGVRWKTFSEFWASFEARWLFFYRLSNNKVPPSSGSWSQRQLPHNGKSAQNEERAIMVWSVEISNQDWDSQCSYLSAAR